MRHCGLNGKATRRLRLLCALSSLWVAFAAPTAKSQGNPPAPGVPPFTTTWLMFGNYQVRTDDATKAANGGRSTDRFDLDRLYLNLKTSPYPRDSVVVTTDLFQQTDTSKAGYYRGWAVRIKYAYLHANLMHDTNGLDLAARIGMIHTAIVPHAETFWPRYLGPTSNERYGFAAGADVGAAAVVTLPSQWGEALATVTNGNGFAAPEADRFKDVAFRLSLTPFGDDPILMRSLTFTLWTSNGLSGSKFLNGGPGQIGPTPDGLRRDRWGTLVGVKHRRLTAAFEYAHRVDGVETGANTVAAPRTVDNRAGDVIEAFALVRPMEFYKPNSKSPFGILARTDRFRSDVNRDGAIRFLVAGVFWDIRNTNGMTFSADYQRQTSQGLETSPEQRTWFIHWQVKY